MRMRSILMTLGATLCVAGPALAGTGIFRSAYTASGSNNATGIAVGDFDGDGTTDVVTANAALGGNELTILVGFNDGTVNQIGLAIPLVSVPSGMIKGKFDADQIDDLIVANGTDSSISFIKGRLDDEYFDPPSSSITVSQGPIGFATADIDGDGKLDLAVANEGSDSSSGTVSVLRGGGDGTFTLLQQDDPNEPGMTLPALPAQLGTRAVALGNIDADPALDIVALNGRSDSVSLYSGDGHGFFTPRGTITTGAAPQDLALVDLNGDTKLDLVIADSNADAIEVRLGNGDRTFAAAQTFAVGTSPSRIQIADIDGDTHLDIVVGNSRSGDVSLLLGNGSGGFPRTRNYVADGEPQVLALGDLNADDQLDVVAATQGGDEGPTVAVLRNRGGGTLQGVEDIPAGSGPAAVATADINDDALADIISAGDSGEVVIFPAQADGFGAALRIDIGGRVLGVLATDLNADARPDIVAVDNENSRVAVLRGTGPGRFAAPATFATAPGPGAITSGDFNSDGRPDLAVTSIGTERTCQGGVEPGRVCSQDGDCGSGGTCVALGTVSVLLQQASGAFGPARLVKVEETPLGIAALDANCDGRDDLVVANQASNTLSVVRSCGAASPSPCTGDNTFVVVQTLSSAQVGQGPIALAAGDFNRDGVTDFVVSNFVTPQNAPSLRSFRGRCDGPFEPVAGQGGQVRPGEQVGSIVARDFTGDQIADIAVVNQTSNAVRIVTGVGDGRFVPTSQNDGVSRMPVAITAGDFDGDGRYDAASGNSDTSADNVSVLYNCARDTGCDPFRPGPPGMAALRGDANNDGARSAADFVAVAAEVIDGDGVQVEDIASGDFGGDRVSPGVDANGDGHVTPQDIGATARRLFDGA